jgi:hypothetical protein
VTKPDGEIRPRTRAVHVSAGVGGAATRLDAHRRLDGPDEPDHGSPSAARSGNPRSDLAAGGGTHLQLTYAEPIPGRIETQRLTTPGDAQPS